MKKKFVCLTWNRNYCRKESIRAGLALLIVILLRKQKELTINISP